MASSNPDPGAPPRPASGNTSHQEAASVSSSSSSRPKQAVDIRIEELTDREVHLLTGILSRRPSFGIGRPSRRWLEHQAVLVARLPPEVRRPHNPLKRFVVKYAAAADAAGAPAVLCAAAHYELHPRLMRRLFLVVVDEVTRHADRLRRFRLLQLQRWQRQQQQQEAGEEGEGEETGPDPELAAFVDRVDGLGALWMEPGLYLETFRAPPADRRMVKVEGFCEACTLAVLGASARTLADLRAIIVDRAERLRERRRRRRLGEAEERVRRREARDARRRERREERRREWEDEERAIAAARDDPDRARWLRSGRAADPAREAHHARVDEMEAHHRRYRERHGGLSPGCDPAQGSSASSSSHRRRKGSKHPAAAADNDDGAGDGGEQSRPDRDPRLLRIVEIWIDHLGPERAAIAREMSDRSLAMLRHYRREIEATRRPRPRPGRSHSHHHSQHHHQQRRQSRRPIPVSRAAAVATPEEAAELRRRADEFRRSTSHSNSGGRARGASVYRPDSLAGATSQVGSFDVDHMPPPPMCGIGPRGNIISGGGGGGGRNARPGAPEPADRFSGTSGDAPTRSFIRRFEREVHVDGGERGEEAASGLDPYDEDADDDDPEDDYEEEEEEEEEYEDEMMMDDDYAGIEDERDYEREERSREKVAAWAVNAWAESRRDLSRAELERGARSVIHGIHPAFRPPPDKGGGGGDGGADAAGAAGSRAFARNSAVPLPLFGGKDTAAAAAAAAEESRPEPPLAKKKRSSVLGSAFGFGLGKDKRADNSGDADRKDRDKDKDKERKRDKASQQQHIPYSESAIWTDVTVRTDWRDHSPTPPATSSREASASLSSPPPPVPRVPSRWGRNDNTGRDDPIAYDYDNDNGDATPRARSPQPPAASLLAGIDPAQSTEAFPAYADQLPDDDDDDGPHPSQRQHPAHDAMDTAMHTGEDRSRTPRPGDHHHHHHHHQQHGGRPHKNPAPVPSPAPWSPAKKPSRKYCFPDSDVGSAVRGAADRQYLKRNRGFLREVPPEANPFLASALGLSPAPASPSRDPKRGSGGGAGGAEQHDPWAVHEERAAAAAAAAAASSSRSSTATGDRSRGTASSGSGGSRSTAATSVLPGRAPTPRVATAEDERRWRRGWGVLDDGDGDGDDFIRPDDSASNVHWARPAAPDDVTQLSDIMRSADVDRR